MTTRGRNLISSKLMAIGFVLALAVPVIAQQRPAAEKIIGTPKIEAVGNTWAVIAWTTNTGGSTIVHYGTDPNKLDQMAEAPYADNDKSVAQNHRVRITNLKPGTTYYFSVISGQGEGTGTQATSNVDKFTTKGSSQGAEKPKAENVKITDGPRVEGTGPTWAIVAWTTNTGGSSVVRYGTDAQHLDQMAESPYSDNEQTQSQNHRVRINNLKPGTTYFFVADSGQGEGTGTEAKSSVAQFSTKPH